MCGIFYSKQELISGPCHRGETALIISYGTGYLNTVLHIQQSGLLSWLHPLWQLTVLVCFIHANCLYFGFNMPS
ncbi:hypothetical protein M514_19846 [Trichuris suis]|uniref:Uncharacterized protein n=1 Tax=Trichuris suis TaxID=68888 RepID=A0A085NES3_9BILA|nr:hypothetical protein M514_19846 [Trichuris suis]